MKRWIRRILFSCSIALMVAAVGLTIRGFMAVDRAAYGRLACCNTYGGVAFGFMPLSVAVARYWNQNPNLWPANWPVYPHLGSWGSTTTLWIPHWLSFMAGAAYPAFAWLRYRRKKKDVGFPVEEVEREGTEARRHAGTK